MSLPFTGERGGYCCAGLAAMAGAGYLEMQCRVRGVVMGDPPEVKSLESVPPARRELIQSVLVPALRSVADDPAPGRKFVFLVGPPGSGKSTLAQQVQMVALEDGLAVDVLAMDGFHHRNDYLRSHHGVVDGSHVRLSEVKGAPETFDVDRLKRFITESVFQDPRWPSYDRGVHDVVDCQIPLRSDVALLEGNWLLLEEPGWQDLADHAAVTITLDGPESLLSQRLIDRKEAGGLSRLEAENFYKTSDGPNVARWKQHTKKDSDISLTLTSEGVMKESGETE